MKSSLVLLTFLICTNVFAQIDRPNVLLIVADDMGYDSPGFAGSVAPNVTPNIDRLAGESVSFSKAFAAVSVCQPSRQSMLSGLIPQHYGSKGFFPMAKGTATLPALLRDAGYLTGIIHKKGHMEPVEDFNWNYDRKKLGAYGNDGVVGRDPVAIAKAVEKFITIADEDQKPFFMVVNSADPHRPFHGDYNRPGKYQPRVPSRVYQPHEVTIPPALPDLPEIREDLAKYASSVRRLDDMVGGCLEVLEKTNVASSTIVIFVSDNGMPLPFGKFDAFLGSNRSPFLVRWPERNLGTRVDDKNLVSLMDITPTLLELAGLPVPSGLDGKSLVTLLEGKEDPSWRKSIVFIRNEDVYYQRSYKNREDGENDAIIQDLKELGWVLRPDHLNDGTLSRPKEIRTHFDGQYGYIYNDCYQADALKKDEMGLIVPYSDASSKAMRDAAKEDAEVRRRYEFYLLRDEEELYDWISDPGSQNNLAKDPNYSEVLMKSRKALYEWMIGVDDSLQVSYKAWLDGKINQ